MTIIDEAFFYDMIRQLERLASRAGLEALACYLRLAMMVIESDDRGDPKIAPDSVVELSDAAAMARELARLLVAAWESAGVASADR